MSRYSQTGLHLLRARITDAFAHVERAHLSELFDAACYTEFVEKAEVRCLMLCEEESSGDIVASHGLPGDGFVQRAGSKTAFFLKQKPLVVTAKNVDALLYGELSTEPLAHLRRLLAEVFVPVMVNPANQEGWGEVACKDIMDKVYRLLADVTITLGRTRGQTWLPLPPATTTAALSSSAAATSGLIGGGRKNEQVYLLETTLIHWTRLIREILKRDPETLLKQGYNPTPDAELHFWRERAADLNAVFAQLQSERVRSVLAVLDARRVPVGKSFRKLVQEVLAARVEAIDNAKFVGMLESVLDEMHGADFEALPESYEVLMHTILGIWKHSSFYNTQPRLIVLINEVGNEIIAKARDFASGEAIFEMIDCDDASTAVHKLKAVLKVCSAFKSAFYDYKTKSSAQCPGNAWLIPNNALFMRLDSFVERVQDVLDLTQTIVQFGKLALVEIGGTKGKTLTTSVRQIYADFIDAVRAFEGAPYDIMDVGAKRFDDDFYAFRSATKELERRLGSIITAAFDDAGTLFGQFKLLDSFESLLERELIHDELEKRHSALVSSYGRDLAVVSELFTRERGAFDVGAMASAPIGVNLPPIAGALKWVRMLMQRIREPMERLLQLDSTIIEKEGARDVLKSFGTTLDRLQQFELATMQQLNTLADGSSLQKLRQPLLKRNKRRLLTVNFDPALVRLLREVKYFQLEGLEVPLSARAIFGKVEVYRQQTGNLELIVNMYNEIIENMLPVERPLLHSAVKAIDEQLQSGIDVLNWKSHGIDVFLSDTMTKVKSASDVLQQLKDNVVKIRAELTSWSSEPLFVRNSKPTKWDDLKADLQPRLIRRYGEIHKGGVRMHALLADSNKILHVSKGQPSWRAYVAFVNRIVADGLRDVVVNSLSYILSEIKAIKLGNKPPILEISLDLFGKSADGMMFVPDLGEKADSGGLRDIVNEWIDDFMHVASLFPRVDEQDIVVVPSGSSEPQNSTVVASSPSHKLVRVAGAPASSATYAKDLLTDETVHTLIGAITEELDASDVACTAFMQTYKEFAYLWTTDLKAMFADFLDEAAPLAVAGDFVTGRQPRLDAFDAQIEQYTKVQSRVAELETPSDIGWLRINSQPIKQALNTCTTKWKFVFTAWLHNHVFDSLKELDTFRIFVKDGLKEAPVDDDALKRIMTIIRAVRRRIDATQFLFGPLEECVALLKKHGEAINAKIGGVDVLEYLDRAPMKWETTVNITFAKKEAILPLQNKAVSELRERLDDFATHVRARRDEFRNRAPFSVQIARDAAPHGHATSTTGVVLAFADAAFARLDEFDASLTVDKATSEELDNLCDLFEVPTQRLPELEQSSVELAQLRALWTLYEEIARTFAEWEETRWTQVETVVLLSRLGKFSDALRSHAAAADGWALWGEVQEVLTNVSNIFPLVESLRTPAMRDRHWTTLAVGCGASPLAHAEASFCLRDMLALQLHHHIEHVETVVNTATTELKIERTLNTIEAIWTAMALEFYVYKDTGVKLVSVSDFVLDKLEEHTAQLQVIVGMGRYVEYFRSRVVKWQHELAHVENVLHAWLEVTRDWQNLESIFLKSAEIRRQLPDDAATFEQVHGDFATLMEQAAQTPNVLKACSNHELSHLLGEKLLPRLERCQASLHNYLAHQRKNFPRFYFVSNDALVRVLSNAKEPRAIVAECCECFYDTFVAIEFDELAYTERGANEILSISSATETMRFEEPFVIDPKESVEAWLTRFEAQISRTLRDAMTSALKSGAEIAEKQRFDWVFDIPAQIVLTTLATAVTEETELALDNVEGGDGAHALHAHLGKRQDRVHEMVEIARQKLTTVQRTAVVNMITSDVHARDVVARLVEKNVKSKQDFAWAQQLRLYYSAPTGAGKTDDERARVNARICDVGDPAAGGSELEYLFQYTGNTARLVVTPLTERCLVTLTKAVSMNLGCLISGPAGAGKTETVKDLAASLGRPMLNFQCGEQMTFKTMAMLLKGLIQNGAWGCFDGINRLSSELLSIAAMQIKSVHSAIEQFADPEQRSRKYRDAPPGRPHCIVGEFDLMGDSVALIPTTAFFATMNPTYAGRHQLPASLKALYRPCAMITPDMSCISENLLLAQGFEEAASLAVKFSMLYKLGDEMLSSQEHYDWSLRSAKAVLVIAGELIRRSASGGERLSEEAVLMRALRDANLPGLVPHDVEVFQRLLRDIFPKSYRVTSAKDDALKVVLSTVCKQRTLQNDAVFASKVAQFQSQLDVRRSVVLLGPAGCGKSTVWKSLLACYNSGYRPRPGQIAGKANAIARVINPKVVSSDELFGSMHGENHAWIEGLLPTVVRGMARNSKRLGFHAYQTSKWVVLDGDVDVKWIESMNSVMDDNCALTLASNERIVLTPEMNVIIETDSLADATPATISRTGIVYISEGDMGWQQFADSWLERRDRDSRATSEMETEVLPNLFKTFVRDIVKVLAAGTFPSVVPTSLISQVATLCALLEELLPAYAAETSCGIRHTLDGLNSLFLFAAAWSFGGAMNIDTRSKFHEAWMATDSLRRASAGFVAAASDVTAAAGAAASAAAGSAPASTVDGDDVERTTIFDFVFDTNTGRLKPWVALIEPRYHVPIEQSIVDVGTVAFSDIFVATAESACTMYLVGALNRRKRPVMLAGPGGSGKTALLREFMRLQDAGAENRLARHLTLNWCTDSAALQAQLTQALEKRSGSSIGPAAGKTMLVFLDDLSMPKADAAGTQSALALVRQLLDQGGWYDRDDFSEFVSVVDTSLIAATTPSQGASRTLKPRVQRHFTTLADAMPTAAAMVQIFGSVVDGHLAHHSFDAKLIEGARTMGATLASATVELWTKMVTHFKPSAAKCVYTWSMRDVARVCQGLCLATPMHYRSELAFARLWLHEAKRVFGDRLINSADTIRFEETVVAASKCYFEAEQEKIHATPLAFTRFVTREVGEAAPMNGAEGAYLPLALGEEGRGALKAALTERLAAYNGANTSSGAMDLVLFEDAMMHVARIVRIISASHGNALLVGLGGSGKQSLARLAAFICDFRIEQMDVTDTTTLEDFGDFLKRLLELAGADGVPIAFILSDTQIVDERFLIYANDLLSMGNVASLFEKAELEILYQSRGFRAAGKEAGVQNSPVANAELFALRVRRNLHLILCMSPAATEFQPRARQFPNIFSRCGVDWFHPWSKPACVAVAQHFLEDAAISTSLCENVAHHMAAVHHSVQRVAAAYLASHGRHVHVTPKSFLELATFYTKGLAAKRGEVRTQIARLEKAIATLKSTSSSVASLQKDVTRSLADLDDKRASTEKLIHEMASQREEAEAQAAEAHAEKDTAAAAIAASDTLEKKVKEAGKAAKPVLERAIQGAKALDKSALADFKNLTKAPAGAPTQNLIVCILVLVEGEMRTHTWARTKKMMGNVNTFLGKLKAACTAVGELSEEASAVLLPLINAKEFEPKEMAVPIAGGLCAILKDTFAYAALCDAGKPERELLVEAKLTKEAARINLKELDVRERQVEAQLDQLKQSFVEATHEKAAVEAEAAHFGKRLDIASRLVSGLEIEKQMWLEEVEILKLRDAALVGDVLLGASFVSYAGGFDAERRVELLQEHWMPDMLANEIPLSEYDDNDTSIEEVLLSFTPEKVLTAMRLETLSPESSAIAAACKRWPLLIDPQLQGMTWLKKRERANGLVVLEQATKGFWKHLVKAVASGTPTLIHNLSDRIDVGLRPLIAKAMYTRGTQSYLRIAGREVEYNPAFRLFLQTRLAKPRFLPEVQAQCTLVDFVATARSLEEQLLARVVLRENPKLEKAKAQYEGELADANTRLFDLEHELVDRLAHPVADILSDSTLIEKLERTKAAKDELEESLQHMEETEETVNEQREVYRSVAVHGSSLYFVLTQLSSIDTMYTYSLDSFLTYFDKALGSAPVVEENLEVDETEDTFDALGGTVLSPEETRVKALCESLRTTIFRWVSRGLKEEHKPALMLVTTLSLLAQGELLTIGFSPELLDFLVRGRAQSSASTGLDASPLEWMTPEAWTNVIALAQFDEFSSLPEDIVEAESRFKGWYTKECPETERLPLQWARLEGQPFLKLCLLRCLRPDRMTVALMSFVREVLPEGDVALGVDATMNSYDILADCLEDAKSTTPIFFALTPGNNVYENLNVLAQYENKTAGKSYHVLSLGQGMDEDAKAVIDAAMQSGHWVVLNNVQLAPDVLEWLEQRLEGALMAAAGDSHHPHPILDEPLPSVGATAGCHDGFRVFLTADSVAGVSVGILSRSIKLTNELPSGLRANLQAAFCTNKADIDALSPHPRAILFGLCYFHAIIAERRKFGAAGFNEPSHFSLQDLEDAKTSIINYVEEGDDGGEIPWEDLRYMVGEIIYGGHIVDSRARLLCTTLLEFIMRDELFDELELYPFVPTTGKHASASFKAPLPTSYDRYLAYIASTLPARESPVAFGMHPNMESTVEMRESQRILAILSELVPAGAKKAGAPRRGAGSPRSRRSAEDVADTTYQVAGNVLNDIEERLVGIGAEFADAESVVRGVVGGVGMDPFQTVLLQECAATHRLIRTVRASLSTLNCGFEGKQTMTPEMDALAQSLFDDALPAAWAAASWTTACSLADWLQDLLRRVDQLKQWLAAPESPPAVLWIGGLFSPQRYLTAVLQRSAQLQRVDLSDLMLVTEVTRHSDADQDGFAPPSRDSVLIKGLTLEGARFDAASGMIADMRDGESAKSTLPIVSVRAVPKSEQSFAGVHVCPVYKVKARGESWVFDVALKTKSPPQKWIIAGVALILE